MIEIVSICLGVTSIGLAIGLSWYRNRQEKRTRIENERFFVHIITVNLTKMTQYFLDVERETQYNEEHEESNTAMMNSLKTFYLRNEQEMKDILYQTKLYLPFWSRLPTEDKQTVEKTLDVFSWLLYDYYQSGLPETIRENAVINLRKELHEKKNWIMNNTGGFLDGVESN